MGIMDHESGPNNNHLILSQCETRFGYSSRKKSGRRELGREVSRISERLANRRKSGDVGLISAVLGVRSSKLAYYRKSMVSSLVFGQESQRHLLLSE